MTTWTDEDETVIRCLHGRYRNKVIAMILDRSVGAVEARVSFMRKRGQIPVRAHFGGQA